MPDVMLSKWVPPYASFRTILHLLDRIKEDDGAPPRIDRSYLKGSEGGKTQVLATLKALGLIDGNGNVSPNLTNLVPVEARKGGFLQLLRLYYAEPNRLGTVNATQKQLEEAFDTWGLNGDTRRKAIAFYLHAAKFCGLPLSKYFKASGGSSSANAKVRRRAATEPDEGADEDDQDEQPHAPTMDELKQQYLAMLLEKAKTEMDDKLLNRIERLMGFQADAGEETTE